MTNKIIKIKKGFKNNIISSFLLGSSIAITMQAQASQRLFPPSERESMGLTEEDQAKIMAKLAKIDFPKKWETVNLAKTDWAEIRKELAKIDPSSKWETVDLVEADWTKIRAKLAKEEKRKKNARDKNRRIQNKRQYNRRVGADGVKITEGITAAAMKRTHDMTHN
jgi:hypothetical protein